MAGEMLAIVSAHCTGICDQYVKVADVELGIDVATIVRTFAHDERIDARYRELQVKKMIANIEKRRTCRR
jgi:hypothetical protein